MPRRDIQNLPPEMLTLAELYAERESLKRFRSIGREMDARSGPNRYRARSLEDAALRAMVIDACIDKALGVDWTQGGTLEP